MTYSLSGDQSSLFNIDPATGVVTVAEGATIDREVTTDLWFRVVATDNAPDHLKKSTSVPVSTISPNFFIIGHNWSLIN